MKTKSHKKKKSQKSLKTDILDTSGDCLEEDAEMPTADVVAAERASEVLYERELAALLLADGSDSGSSDGEARLRGALRPLQLRQPATCALPPPPAAALLAQLVAALHAHDTRFLDEYKALVDKRSAAEVRAVTEELMRSLERALAGEGAEGAARADGVVLAAWLAAAIVWREPRVPGALCALRRLLQFLLPPQVNECAGALHAALQPRELLAAGDALRGERLGELLLRATLAKLVGREPAWAAGAPTARDLQAALTGHEAALDAANRLAALALAGRALAGEAGGAGRRNAGALLAALAPPPPKDKHDPDYLKVSAALKTLQNLFKDK